MTIISILRNGRYVIPESTRLSAVVLQLAIIFSVVPLCSSVQLLCQTFLDVPLSRCIFARKGRQEGESGRHVLWLFSFPFPCSLSKVTRVPCSPLFERKVRENEATEKKGGNQCSFILL